YRFFQLFDTRIQTRTLGAQLRGERLDFTFQALALAAGIGKLGFVLRTHLPKDFGAYRVLAALELHLELLDFDIQLFALGIPGDSGLFKFLFPIAGGFAARSRRTGWKLTEPFKNGPPRRLFLWISPGGGRRLFQPLDFSDESFTFSLPLKLPFLF